MSPVARGETAPLLSLRDVEVTFTTEHGFPRSMSVTSTRPAEGKSSTSLALATILARLGKRVVLHSYEVARNIEDVLVAMQSVSYVSLREDAISVEHLSRTAW